MFLVIFLLKPMQPINWSNNQLKWAINQFKIFNQNPALLSVT